MAQSVFKKFGCILAFAAIFSVNVSAQCTAGVAAASGCPGSATTVNLSPGPGFGPESYYITWGSSAQSEGFADVLTTPFPAGATSINVSVPAGADPGSYSGSLTFEHSSGCSHTAVFSIEVHALPTVAGGIDKTVCLGASTTLSGSGAVSYSWTGGVTDGVPFSPAATATYTVTGTDANGCQATDDVLVTVNPLPTITGMPADYSICMGQSTTLNVSGTGDTYTWDNGVANNIAFAPGISDTYTVTAEITATGCTATDDVQITVNALPTVSAGNDFAICAGQTATLNGAGASSYTWDNSVSDGVAFTPAATATYTVTGTDGNGCQNTDQVIVSVNPLPNVSAGADFAVCTGQQATLTGTGNANTYAWDNSVLNGVAFIPATTNTYTVTGTITATGCQNTDQVTVTVNPLPNVSAGIDQTVCYGDMVTLSGSGASTYSWNNGVTNNAAFAAAATTTYTVTGTDGNGCQNTDQMTLTVNPLPTVNIPSNYAICAGQSTTLNATGTGNTYTWNNGINNNVSFSPGATATYTVTGEITATGCTNTGSVTVTINPLPAVDAGPDQSVCYNATVTLSGSGANTYTWNNGITNNIAFNALSTTTYTVTGTDGNGCQNTDQAVVTVNALQPAAFTVSTSTVYTGQVGVTYTVPNDPLVDYYTWSATGTGATATGSSTSSETFSFSTSASTGNRTVSVVAHTNTPACASPARTMSVYVSDEMPWTGATNTDWHTAGNWAGNFVPYGTIKALVPATGNDPEVSANTNIYGLRVQSGAEVSLDPGTEVSVATNLTVNGTISGGTIILNGTDPQLLAGTGSIANLKLDNSDGAAIVSGDLGISETYQSISGVLTTNGHLRLLSDASGTASVLAPVSCAAEYIDGEVTVEKYIPGGRRVFRFICHPFSEWKPVSILTDDIDVTGNGGATNGFTTTGTNNPSAFWFDTWVATNDTTNDVQGWLDFHTATGFGTASWDPGEGMRILIRGAKGEGLDSQPYTPSPVTLTMPGNLTQCDVTYHLRKNANIGVTGFNFIGNPYACNIDLSLTNRGAGVGPNFWVWDANMGTRGQYVSYPFSSSYILPSLASFFVNNDGDTNGVDNIISFDESMKTAASADDNLFKTTASAFGPNSVQLRIESDNGNMTWDRLLVFFDGTTLAGKDGKDARKLNANNAPLNFYTLADTNRLSIDCRPLAANTTVLLGLKADSMMQYTIRVADYDVAGAQLYLIDKFLNTTTPMSEGMQYDFNVTSNPLTQGNNRFEIGIGTTGVGQLSGHNISMSLSPNPAEDMVSISFDAVVNGPAQISIANLVGQQLLQRSLGNVNTAEVVVSLKDLPSGMYMVTVSCGEQKVTQRLIKK